MEGLALAREEQEGAGIEFGGSCQAAGLLDAEFARDQILAFLGSYDTPESSVF
jgi:hypothetical protein